MKLKDILLEAHDTSFLLQDIETKLSDTLNVANQLRAKVTSPAEKQLVQKVFQHINQAIAEIDKTFS